MLSRKTTLQNLRLRAKKQLVSESNRIPLSENIPQNDTTAEMVEFCVQTWGAKFNDVHLSIVDWFAQNNYNIVSMIPIFYANVPGELDVPSDNQNFALLVVNFVSRIQEAIQNQEYSHEERITVNRMRNELVSNRKRSSFHGSRVAPVTSRQNLPGGDRSGRLAHLLNRPT